MDEVCGGGCQWWELDWGVEVLDWWCQWKELDGGVLRRWRELD